MSTGPIHLWAAAATASLLLLSPPAAPRPRPATLVSVGCTTTVDTSDPLAVARVVATWMYCRGPAGVLSPHGQRVLARWSSVERPPSPAAVTNLRFGDPRASPVVVSADVAGTARRHVLLLTLFWRPGGGWVVDDLAVVDR